VIKKGFFTKRTITLPLEKIQAVHADQTWLHSLLNVSRLSFDSAGSEKMEVKIEALDQFRSTALKEFILGHRVGIHSPGEAVQQPPEEILVRLSGRDLFKLSISANHLKAFILLLVFISSSLQSVGVSDKEYNGVLQWLGETFQTDTFKLFLFLALAALVIGVGISVITVILTYSDFMISETSKGFRIKSGLINKKEKFVPFRKIQFISWKANWIRNKMGMFLLQLHATGTGHLENKMQVKVPVTRPSFIPPLLSAYHPLLPVNEILPVRIHKNYVGRRVLLFGILPAVAAAAVLYFYVQEKAFIALAWIVITWITCFLFQQKFRLWAGAEALQVKKGIFGIHELVLKWDKIQSAHLAQSLYQKRHNLATVELHTAGGKVILPWLALQQARQIRNYALYKIESSAQPWS
ncbi:MAG: PH domain-containing protein, partial [Ferruginibacter sp.]|nr:PH domain-containing protein [Chitinophagaceae bacterium]